MRVTLVGALQGFRCARGTLVVAFAILTLAMAAATVTFSVVDSVALRSLPYASPRQLVGIASPGLRAGTVSAISPGDYFLLKDGTQAFASVAASRPSPPSYLEKDGRIATLATRRVTTNLFDTLGVRPAAGRLFSSDDERSGSPVAAVLGYELWAHTFGSDPGIIGQTVNFAQQPMQIIGVLPSGVWHPMELPPAAVYIPYVATDAERSNTRVRGMSVVARRKPGITFDQARADVFRVSTTPTIVLPLQDQVIGPSKRWLFLLLAAVGLVVLIACVNVATLLLARAVTRGPEFAIRASLGQSRRDIGASLLVEGLVIAFAAGGSAIVLSVWGVEAVKAILPPGLLTRVSTIAIDSRVMLTSVAVASVSAALFSIAPLWLARRSDLMAVMKSAGGPVIGGRLVERTLAAFLVGEVAVVCVLLVVTTLVVRSFILITTTDLGFDRQNIVTIEYQREASGSEALRQAAGATLRAEVLARAKLVPGVVDAAISISAPVPLAGASVRYSVVIPGFGETRDEDMMETRIVTPEYFGVMGMQLASGRLLDSGDRAGGPPVMLINDVAARRFFPGRNPVGEIVTFRGPTTIVGVTRGVRFEGPESETRPEMYVPADQERSRMPRDIGSVVVRTSAQPQEVGAAVRDAIRPLLGVEPNQPQVVDEFFKRMTAGRRFNAAVMAAFGLIAIALGIVGIYGTMQFLVSRRFRDIGLRLALGASRARILRSVLATALRRLTVGTTLGLIAAWLMSNAFRSFVFGIRPTEPGVYAQVAGVIALIGLAAALVPATRAARLDPADTLRRE